MRAAGFRGPRHSKSHVFRRSFGNENDNLTSTRQLKANTWERRAGILVSDLCLFLLSSDLVVHGRRQRELIDT
jgi:hypothetical protein